VADRWASDEQESNLKMEFNSLIRLKFDSAQMMPSQTRKKLNKIWSVGF
jgi:hypothetical protein